MHINQPLAWLYIFFKDTERWMVGLSGREDAAKLFFLLDVALEYGQNDVMQRSCDARIENMVGLLRTFVPP